MPKYPICKPINIKTTTKGAGTFVVVWGINRF